jgi:hypothetical protein
MKNERDPLEAELAALRPHAVSPELRQRIAERLVEKRDCRRAEEPDFRKRTLTARWLSLFINRRMALAGSLAAAGLVAVVVWWGGGRDVETKKIAEQPQPAPPVKVADGEGTYGGVADADLPDGDVEDTVPTLLAYQRALARSPEELEALLNKHALVSPVFDPQLVLIGAFTRSDAALHALLGDD